MNFKQLDLLKNSLIDWNVNYSVYPYNGYTINEVLCQFFDAINKGIVVINDYTKWVDELMNWIKLEGLENEVREGLEKMISDGVFNDIINTSIFNELNASVNKNTINIQKTSSDLEKIKMTQKVYVDTYIEDDVDEGILKALAENENKTICFTEKTYEIKKPINIINGNSISLCTNTVIKAVAPMDYMISFHTNFIANSINDLIRDKEIKKGVFDCNNMAIDCFRLANYLHLTISDIVIMNVKGKGIKTREKGNLSAELVLNNIRMENKTINDASVGIYNNSSDNIINNVIMLNFKTGLYNNAFLIASNIHPWISISELFPNSTGFDIRGICIADKLYSDTYQYNYKVSNGGTFKLTNSDCFINTVVVNEDVQSNNTVFVFHIDETSNVTINNVVVVNDLKNLYFLNEDSNTFVSNNVSVINKPGCNVINYKLNEYVETIGNKIKKVYETPGFKLLFENTLKGYLAVTTNSVGLSNDFSGKGLYLKDDGSITYGDNNICTGRTDIPNNPGIGDMYFNQGKGIPLFWNGVAWVKSDGNLPT